MKTQITLLILIAALTGCGKELPSTAALTTTNGGTVTVSGGLACPEGMTHLSATVGRGETCISQGQAAVGDPSTAGLTCLQAGANLCGALELLHGITVSVVPVGAKYWTRDTLTNGNPVWILNGTINSGASVGNGQFFCCSR